jgi:hypothetical protein
MLVVALCLMLAAVLFIKIPGWLGGRAETLTISVNNQPVGTYSLHQRREIAVTGPLGATQVTIEHGTVRISDSPCPHKLCVTMGPIGKQGGVLVCVPNRVVVTVGVQSSDTLDAVTQ